MLINSDVAPLNKDNDFGLEAAASLEFMAFLPINTVLISCKKLQSEILIF